MRTPEAMANTIKSNKAIFLITAFVVAAHISYIPNGFTWLDHNDIEQKRAGLPIGQVYKAFITPFGETSFYRPMVTIANSIDNRLYGHWAPGYHLTNVLLHLGVVILAPVFLSVFFDLTARQKFWAMLIVGLHPASILVVGSIIQRQELLVTIFIMLTLIFYKRAREKGRWRDVYFTGVAMAGALLSKETALVLIPVLIIMDKFFNENLGKINVRLWIIGAGTMAAYAALRMKVVPKIWGTGWGELSIGQHIATRLGLAGKWILLLVSPFKSNFSDAVRVMDWTNWYVWVVILLLAGVGVIIWKAGVRSGMGKAILMILILLAPGLNIIPVPRVGSPHYGYLPVLGLAGLAAVLLGKLKKGRRMAGIVLGIWLGIAAMTVFRAGFQFENDETLFKAEVEKDRNFEEGYYYLGNYYLKSRNLAEARKYYERGLAEKKNYLYFSQKRNMLINLGGIKLETGDARGAYEIYDAMQDSVGEDMKPYVVFNLALAAREMGDNQKVVEILGGRRWQRPEPYMLLNQALESLGRINSVPLLQYLSPEPQ